MRRWLVGGFGFAFGMAAWRNAPVLPDGQAAALGTAVGIALALAFWAGYRYGPERDAEAVTSAVAAAIVNARVEAAAHARASATQLVYVAGSDGGANADVVSLDNRRRPAASIDPMEAHELVLENYGLDLPYEAAAELINEVITENTTSKVPADSDGRTAP